jgi:hypothetical protein
MYLHRCHFFKLEGFCVSPLIFDNPSENLSILTKIHILESQPRFRQLFGVFCYKSDSAFYFSWTFVLNKAFHNVGGVAGSASAHFLNFVNFPIMTLPNCVEIKLGYDNIGPGKPSRFTRYLPFLELLPSIPQLFQVALNYVR